MLFFGPLLVLLAIGFFCWLLFTLAVFALPAFVALTVGMWAVHTGAGVFGGVIVTIIAGGAAFGLGRMALAFLPIVWLRLLILLLFVATAAVAGYNATQGIAQVVTPSGAWQALFSLVGAIAVGVTALLRFTGMTSPGSSGRGVARG